MEWTFILLCGVAIYICTKKREDGSRAGALTCAVTLVLLVAGQCFSTVQAIWGSPGGLEGFIIPSPSSVQEMIFFVTYVIILGRLAGMAYRLTKAAGERGRSGGGSGQC